MCGHGIFPDSAPALKAITKISQQLDKLQLIFVTQAVEYVVCITS